ncbi:PDR/VanB family oxidoreductase [Rhodoblastus acidophilus]|uniref:PDR/VanB family oxidoreductase n=1 Tax=Candidatus Rhodoblastus alkanivorans TaxID=2954117 RepID=A0ABS9Z3Z6_9HYPH|nr:PDR/VanB family oxidoreductase [Candidatus Rhodoblastus alkanivorans]MCI4679971.1 PDR/VanB family oxidoreductase [Candidatus Rhodoblastus alkanivorans]MCI4682354.1 PDR/VanB family oxidoreductase [Candidatus Rhodoblastus alkanivorans]MDI4639657.1 PDR/VanB family oxidoreductase [Rhodoblastus acidophilus]
MERVGGAPEAWLFVEVAERHAAAQDIAHFVFKEASGRDLPPFSAGAHIEIELPNGMQRCYSLCNAPGQGAAYEIAILREASGRGGSLCAHADLHLGARLRIRPPRNYFPLHDEPHALLVAGGVGVTPLLAMAEQLRAEGRGFEFHFCARSPSRAAFLDRLRRAPYGASVRLHFDDGAPDQIFNAREIFERAPAGAGLYVCGPNGFMDYVLSAARSAGWSEGRLHYEYFAAVAAPTEGDRPFSILLARSGKRVFVPAGKTAAEAMIDAGVEFPMSCEQGVCGTCALPVLKGAPDHRDHFQTKAEREANTLFMPCCSRALTEELVLDF